VVVRSKRGTIALAGTVGLLSAVAGCAGGRGVNVPLGSEELDQCPPRSIAVEDLHEIGEPGCNLVGSSLIFPDGQTLSIYGVGETFSSSYSGAGEHDNVVVNWGIPGVGAYTQLGDELVDLWATSDEAERLQRELAEVSDLRSE
jgi:hypothetical protein